MVFVAAVTRIGVDGAMDVFGPKILQHVPALFARVADNDDLLRTLPVPALVCHGSEDGVLLPQASETLASLLPQARLQRFAEEVACVPA